MNKVIFVALFSIFISGNLHAESQCVPIGTWVDTKTKKQIAVKEILKTAASKKVILLGEDHDNEEHHRWQLSMIAQAYSRNPNIAIGFEMFPRAVQPILDDWVAGELSETEFLKQTKWHEVWNYNPAYYLPMFHFARINRIPMFALNIPRAMVSQIGELGWNSLSEKSKETIGAPAPVTPAYKKMLLEIFEQHKTHGKEMLETGEVVEDPAENYFIQGQLAWDRAMAGAIMNALEQNKVETVVAVMGAGHIIPTMSVPYQLSALGVEKTVSLMPWDDSMPCDDFSDEFADFVFGVDKKGVHGRKGPYSRARLGVYLELVELGVQVTRVVDDSVAAKTGLQKDDIIIEIAGKPATDIRDVVNAVNAMAPGTWLPIEILRLKKKIQYVAKFPAG